MREQLNNNPLAQLAVVGVLLVFGGFFLMSSMGGGGGEAEESAAPEEAATAIESEAVEAEEASASSAPVLPESLAATIPPPRDVVAAFEANQTVVLLFVRNGGIDDRMVVDAASRLAAMPEVATWVVPADEIARYAAITQGVAIDRVPALVVIRPKGIGRGTPSATVSYGFQSPESVEQAVIDAGYRGRTLEYHP